RLGDEITRARLHDGDGELDAAERGHEQHELGRLLRQDGAEELGAAHLWHLDVGDDEVVRLRSDACERLGRRGDSGRAEAVLGETLAQELDHAGLVVEHEDALRRRGAHATRVLATAASTTGKCTVKRVPTSFADETSIAPRCSSTIALTTARPSPVPP